MDRSTNQSRLIELMHAFYTLTKIRTVVYDNRFRLLAAVPDTDCAFCTALRKNPEMQKRCDQSVVAGGSISRAGNRLHVYKCHAGLLEAVAPIHSEDIIVGYMMMGQLLEDKDQEKARERILSYAAACKADIIGAFDRLTVKSYDEVCAAAKIMESCVCYLNYSMEKNENSLAISISRYIRAHLSQDLTAKTLCTEFCISRNRLYDISETFFGMPIGAFVRQKRIEAAGEWIKNGCSMTKAAEITGFCDYTYFGKVFKTCTGMTPLEWKKKNTSLP